MGPLSATTHFSFLYWLSKMKSKIKNIQNSKFTPFNQFVRRYITNVGLRGILILIIIIEHYVWSDNFIMYI